MRASLAVALTLLALLALLVGCQGATPAAEPSISFVWFYGAGDSVRADDNAPHPIDAASGDVLWNTPWEAPGLSLTGGLHQIASSTRLPHAPPLRALPAAL